MTADDVISRLDPAALANWRALPGYERRALVAAVVPGGLVVEALDAVDRHVAGGSDPRGLLLGVAGLAACFACAAVWAGRRLRENPYGVPLPGEAAMLAKPEEPLREVDPAGFEDAYEQWTEGLETWEKETWERYVAVWRQTLREIRDESQALAGLVGNGHAAEFWRHAGKLLRADLAMRFARKMTGRNALWTPRGMDLVPGYSSKNVNAAGLREHYEQRAKFADRYFDALARKAEDPVIAGWAATSSSTLSPAARDAAAAFLSAASEYDAADSHLAASGVAPAGASIYRATGSIVQAFRALGMETEAALFAHAANTSWLTGGEGMRDDAWKYLVRTAEQAAKKPASKYAERSVDGWINLAEEGELPDKELAWLAKEWPKEHARLGKRTKHKAPDPRALTDAERRLYDRLAAMRLAAENAEWGRFGIETLSAMPSDERRAMQARLAVDLLAPKDES